jgi:hypothetical protein
MYMTKAHTKKNNKFEINKNNVYIFFLQNPVIFNMYLFIMYNDNQMYKMYKYNIPWMLLFITLSFCQRFIKG